MKDHANQRIEPKYQTHQQEQSGPDAHTNTNPSNDKLKNSTSCVRATVDSTLVYTFSDSNTFFFLLPLFSPWCHFHNSRPETFHLLSLLLILSFWVKLQFVMTLSNIPEAWTKPKYMFLLQITKTGWWTPTGTMHVVWSCTNLANNIDCYHAMLKIMQYLFIEGKRSWKYKKTTCHKLKCSWPSTCVWITV